MHHQHHLQVFVTGASGYIGSEVAAGYRRAGHVVHGLVRSKEKARELAKLEVLPVVGDLQEKEGKWIETDFERTDTNAVETIISSLASVSTPTHPSRFIYTSGMLVYKSAAPPKTPLITDDSPLDDDDDGASFLQPRIRNERKVFEAFETTNGHVIGFVVRPAYVYGRNSRNYYEYFDQAIRGDIVIHGDPAMINPTIHIDDLVAGYLLLTTHPWALIHSRPFIFASPSEPTSVRQIAQAFGRAAGHDDPVIRVEPATPMQAVLQKSFICDPVNARELLAWEPKHSPLLQEVHALWTRWSAVKGAGEWE